MLKVQMGFGRLNFRAKLSTIIGTTAIGFFILIISNIMIAHRVERQLEIIHRRYIPLIEVGPRLETQFGQIARGLQDAVAAHDAEAFVAIDSLNKKFIAELTSSVGVIDPALVSALRLAADEYYSIAQDVSRRIMAGETGQKIVDVMIAMRTKHGHAKELLQKAIVFDQRKLAEAFSDVSKAQETAGQIQFFISLLCLFSVTLLSFWISRGVIQSLSSLTNGLSRFSEGDFGQSIPVTTMDELGDVASQANQMASQIQSLLDKLAATNKELESFSYSVAHDLRAPLRASLGFSNALLEDHLAVLPPDAQSMLKRVAAASERMSELIDGLLSLSRLSRSEMSKKAVDVSMIARSVVDSLREGDPERNIQVKIKEKLTAHGDPGLIRAVFENLIGNAWKFTKKRSDAQIKIGMHQEDGKTIFYIQDNGAGFDMRYSDKLFGTFQRLHSATEFEGTGIGLATVQRIIHRHGGKIWAKAEPDKGATFSFTLGN